MISGSSRGTGKFSLARKIPDALLGIFPPDRPYGAFEDALKELSKRIKSNHELLETYREQIASSGIPKSDLAVMREVFPVFFECVEPQREESLGGNESRFLAPFLQTASPAMYLEIYANPVLVASFLKSLATAKGGLVLVLRNLDSASKASKELLEHLLSLEEDIPGLSLVVTTADEEVAERWSGRFATHIRLGNLDRDALSNWLWDKYGDMSDKDRLVDLVYRHTKGNPLHVYYFLRLLEQQGCVFSEPNSTLTLSENKANRVATRWIVNDEAFSECFPSTLEGFVTSYLSHLSQQVKTILGFIAGLSFDGTVVSVPVLELALKQTFREIWQYESQLRGLVEQDDGSSQLLVFCRQEIQTIVYNCLFPSEDERT